MGTRGYSTGNSIRGYSRGTRCVLHLYWLAMYGMTFLRLIRLPERTTQQRSISIQRIYIYLYIYIYICRAATGPVRKSPLSLLALVGSSTIRSCSHSSRDDCAVSASNTRHRSYEHTTPARAVTAAPPRRGAGPRQPTPPTRRQTRRPPPCRAAPEHGTKATRRPTDLRERVVAVRLRHALERAPRLGAQLLELVRVLQRAPLPRATCQACLPYMPTRVRYNIHACATTYTRALQHTRVPATTCARYDIRVCTIPGKLFKVPVPGTPEYR